MALQFWKDKDKSRAIYKRLIVEATLILQTPAHFGNGDSDALTDMPLLVDALDDHKPLLTGSTLVGALRGYLSSLENGFYPLKIEDEQDKANQRLIDKLFGGNKTNDEGEQSVLIVEDALGTSAGTTIRHHVKLDSKTRTATNDLLFNTQLWQAGTQFPLRFELLICWQEKEKNKKAVFVNNQEQGNYETELIQSLAMAFDGLVNGSITLGGRKRRGYGQITISNWETKFFDLHQPDQLCDYLLNGAKPLAKQQNVKRGKDIFALLQTNKLKQDARRYFSLHGTFNLDGSLMIRSGEGRDDLGPDMVHLHGRQPNGKNEPVVSGTSLAGALRARAAKIVRTLGKDTSIVDELFGPDLNKKQNDQKITPKASKLTVRERVVENGITDLVQNRVSIDRFTGGARDTALFDEQPVWGKPETVVTVDLHLVNPKDCEIGLLLLLLKDLWTGDLALGGESSIGRGRLKGKWAELICHTASPQKWVIVADSQADPQNGNGKLKFEGSGSPDALQTYVDALNNYLNPT